MPRPPPPWRSLHHFEHDEFPLEVVADHSLMRATAAGLAATFLYVWYARVAGVLSVPHRSRKHADVYRPVPAAIANAVIASTRPVDWAAWKTRCLWGRLLRARPAQTLRRKEGTQSRLVYAWMSAV